jgi:hypothetical protein
VVNQNYSNSSKFNKILTEFKHRIYTGNFDQTPGSSHGFYYLPASPWSCHAGYGTMRQEGVPASRLYGMKKNHLLFVCSFLFSLSSNILSLSFVYLLTDRFSFNPAGVGAYAAMGSFAYFLGCSVYHRTQGRPWRVIPMAVSVTFVSSVLLGQVRDYRVVAICYVLVQGSTGLYWPPLMAWFTQGLDEDALNRDISVFNWSWMMGNLLGPLIAGALYHWNSLINFLAINMVWAIPNVLRVLYFLSVVWPGSSGLPSLPALPAGILTGAGLSWYKAASSFAPWPLCWQGAG